MPRNDAAKVIAGLIGFAVVANLRNASAGTPTRRATTPGNATGSHVPPWTPAGVPAVDPGPAGDARPAWVLSDAARASDHSNFIYVGGGPYDPAACAHGPTAHARELAATIRSTFAWVHTIGDVRCGSLNGNQNSVHAVGRALDVMTLTHQAPEGETLANWLVANADPLGIQLVIWNHKVWQGSLPPARRFGNYTGTNPHVDHVHVEVTT